MCRDIDNFLTNVSVVVELNKCSKAQEAVATKTVKHSYVAICNSYHINNHL